MSIHATISIVLKVKDRNKNFNVTVGNEIFVFNAKGKKFLSIYVHYDGYFGFTGEYLQNNLKSYDDVLKFILNGDRGNVLPNNAYTNHGENWIDNKPCATNNIEDNTENFMYLFMNNKWYGVHDIYNDNWKPLTDLI